MKRYKVVVEKIKSTEFELNANNKKEAQKMVEEIIYKTEILNLKCVEHDTCINYVVKRKDVSI